MIHQTPFYSFWRPSCTFQSSAARWLCIYYFLSRPILPTSIQDIVCIIASTNHWGSMPAGFAAFRIFRSFCCSVGATWACTFISFLSCFFFNLGSKLAGFHHFTRTCYFGTCSVKFCFLWPSPKHRCEFQLKFCECP